MWASPLTNFVRLFCENFPGRSRWVKILAGTGCFTPTGFARGVKPLRLMSLSLLMARSLLCSCHPYWLVIDDVSASYGHTNDDCNRLADIQHLSAPLRGLQTPHTRLVERNDHTLLTNRWYDDYMPALTQDGGFISAPLFVCIYIYYRVQNKTWFCNLVCLERCGAIIIIIRMLLYDFT